MPTRTVDVSAAPPASQGSKFAPTLKQWLYVQERIEQVQAGQWLTQAATAARVHVGAPTVSIWNRSEAFRVWFAAQVREAREPLVEAAKAAICVRTIQGNSKFGALFLQMLGYDGGGPLDPLFPNAPHAPAGAVAQASVTFIGLPMPPTPAQAAAVNPPPGSAEVYRPTLPPGK